MTFGDPKMFYLLFLFPVFFVIWKRTSERRLARAACAPRQWNLKRAHRKKWVRCALHSVAFLSFVIALARPRLGFEWINASSEGVDVLVAFDVSNSMRATDMSPSRLESARRQVIDLLSHLKDDRFGLIAFAGQAFDLCPFTKDYDTALSFVDLLNPDLISEQGTDFELLLQNTFLRFDQATGGAENKVLLILSDGENQEGDFSGALAKFREKGFKIFTFGFGSVDGVPIPDESGSLKKDSRGNLILTQLGTSTLTDIATKTNGKFTHVQDNLWSLGEYFDKTIRPGFKAYEQKNGQERMWHERYQWPLAVAAAALLIDTLIIELVPVALAFLIFFMPELNASELEKWRRAAERNPRSARSYLNLGAELHKEGKYDEASTSLNRAVELSENDPETRKKALFNRGNNAVASNRLEDAKKDYEESLKIDPSQEKTKANLDWVNKKLASQSPSPQPSQSPAASKEPDNSPSPSAGSSSQPQTSPGESPSPSSGQASEQPSASSGPQGSSSPSPTSNAQDKKESGSDAKASEIPSTSPTPAAEIERLLRQVPDRPRFAPKNSEKSKDRRERKDW